MQQPNKRKRKHPVSRLAVSELAVSELAVSELAVSELAVSELAVSEPVPSFRLNSGPKAEGEARPAPAPRVEVQAAETALVALATMASTTTGVAPGPGTASSGADCAGVDTSRLMEAIVTRENMHRALKRVVSNQGAPGVDGLHVDDLEFFLREAWSWIKAALLAGQYRPNLVLRVSIPKPDGGVRELGIPTALDRLIQQAIHQVLEPLLDPTFSPHSYGFRPGKSAHGALEAARSSVEAGYDWVVDLDVEQFFDRVHHDLLMGRLANRITDKRLLKLVRAYLEAGVLIGGVTGGVVHEREEGMPQGGPLSPLLANLLLDDLDKELERRGLRFSRYADDCNIYVRSERAGQRVMEGVSRFLERKLKLRVNPKKSAVSRPEARKFLGQRIIDRRRCQVPTWWDAPRDQQPVTLHIHPRSLERFKQEVRRVTRRRRGVSLTTVLRELRLLTDGWVAYHRYTHNQRDLKSLDGWIRHRLRCFIWQQWKRPATRGRELHKRGIDKELAYWIGYHVPSQWKASMSKPVQQALPNRWLKDQGFSSLAERFTGLLAQKPVFREPNAKFMSSGTAGCGPACPVV